MDKKKDYSHTINLPKTFFNMKANLPLNEPKLIKRWNEIKLYDKLCEKNKNKQKFILHDGPPYANAHIHIGTGLNKILKDFIVKYRFMIGNYVQFIPGWDCHGLPIEQLVLKEFNLNKNNVNKLLFRKQASDFAKKFINIQKEEFKRLGIIANWDFPYLTLDPIYESHIIKTFCDLVKNGFIYRKKKPVYWCQTCETAIAEAEVEYSNYISDSIFIKFRMLKNDNFKFKIDDFSILIWTTTPWTLPANVAVAFNKTENYVMAIYTFENGIEEKLIVSKNLLIKIKDKINAKKVCVVFEMAGNDFIGFECINPLTNKLSECIIADFVSINDGTGIVHIAPGYGFEDYDACLKYNFDIISIVDEKGVFNDEVEEFKNISIFEANKLIINKLKNTSNLILESKIDHSYPHCWRCKNPIIFRATNQWFLSIDHNGLREKLIKSVEKVSWIPKYGKSRILSMLKNRPDWCLSRQRIWGVPIPVFYCKKCYSPLLNTNVIDYISLLFRKNGSDLWFKLNEKELLKEIDVSCSCGSIEFKKEDDIFDVWFDSGVSHRSVLENDSFKESNFPADLYLEGSDQHRGWFQTSIILSVALKNEPPYKNVLTHGFVVDGYGKKMSKSINNVTSTDELIKKYGSDIIRLWISLSDYKEDIKISSEIFSGISDTYRKIRNTIKFLLGNICDFDLSFKNLDFCNIQDIDRYALNKLQDLILIVTNSYGKYEFHKAAVSISDFCFVFLSNFYLNIIKDILYCDKKNSDRRISSQFTILEICSVIIKLMAPILSFTADEAWHELKKILVDIPESVFLANFPKINNEYVFVNYENEKWEKMLHIRKKVFCIYEELRKKKIIGSTLDASVNIIYGKKYADCFKNLYLINLIIENWDTKYENSNCINDNDIIINITKSLQKKCIRCWRYIDNVKNDLCLRCSIVME
jgi:isoleucyl-tRNA synthetase